MGKTAKPKQIKDEAGELSEFHSYGITDNIHLVTHPPFLLQEPYRCFWSTLTSRIGPTTRVRLACEGKRRVNGKEGKNGEEGAAESEGDETDGATAE